MLHDLCQLSARFSRSNSVASCTRCKGFTNMGDSVVLVTLNSHPLGECCERVHGHQVREADGISGIVHHKRSERTRSPIPPPSAHAE